MHRDGAKLLKKEEKGKAKKEKKKKRKTFADVYYQTTRLASQSFAILNRSESRGAILLPHRQDSPIIPAKKDDTLTTPWMDEAADAGFGLYAHPKVLS